MNGRVPIHAVDNDIYASINKQRKTSRQMISQSMRHPQDVPLPPPPPPIPQHLGSAPPSVGLSDTESESYRYRPRDRESSAHRSDNGTMNSSRSSRSKQSKQSRRVRHSPQPTTITPSSNRRRPQKRQQREIDSRENLDLVSTNL